MQKLRLKIVEIGIACSKIQIIRGRIKLCDVRDGGIIEHFLPNYIPLLRFNANFNVVCFQ